MFDNLVQFAPGTTQIEPGLAESWTISDDALVYTFRLRTGVKFHSSRTFKPTRDFNAEDVLFSFSRQWKEDHPYHRVSSASFDYFKDMEMPTLLKSVEAVDARTVRITLSRPEAPLLADLAMPFAVIHSAEYAERLLKAGIPGKIDEEPIGTGPFMFAGYHRDVSLRFRAFPDHWAGRQAIETLVFSITPNPVVRLTKLKAGECHLMAFPAPSDAAQIAANTQLDLYRQEGLNIGYLAINTTRAPFDDVRVRRALNLAIDKASIVATVYQDVGTPAKNPIPPTLWSYADDVKDYPYDPRQAQRLLIEAGYAEGFDSELWYMPVSRPYNPNAKRTAEMIQTDLAKVGIRVRLVTDEWSRYRARLQAGEPPMALFGWTGDNGDPDNFLNLLLGCASSRTGGNNIAKWCHRDYDALVTRAKQLSARSEREPLYREAQAIFKREAPWVPLAHSVVLMAARKEVQGFRMDPFGRTAFETVDLKQ
ncbi:MAG: dipeptide transport system substrate-binding protein, partial [Variibacter sp.]|nr:dipeptide transport system substrate-binding protein [Variibacter sp.]